MPKEFSLYGGRMKKINFKDENEIPLNVKSFIREIKSRDLGYKFEFSNYDITTETESSSGDVTVDHELCLQTKLDAEKYVKNEYSNLEEIKDSFNRLSPVFGIDSVYVHSLFVGKEEFAKKFLKNFKSYMKSTPYGGAIHAIKFELSNQYEMTITIIKKSYISPQNWVRDSTLKDLAKEYLKSQGYSHIHIYIP